MKNFELGKDVRRAWHELVTVVELEGLPWTEKEIGYVLIPQWGAEPREVLELWVGVKLDGTERIPAGAEVLHIPARTYAAVPVRGDREQMMRAYSFIEEWINREGLVKDTDEGVYGLEPNRIVPDNPFDIPADTIDRFDFDIMVAIKD
jgi:predicted transcriptional regulator YdeE